MKFIRASRKFSFSFQKQQYLLWENQSEYQLSYFASGREGLVALIKALGLGGKKILIPAYVPEGIIAPFQIHGCEIFMYDLKPDLSPDYSQFESILKQENISLAVVIHYFGILMPIQEGQKLCSQYHSILVEDLAHLLAGPESPAGKTGDVVLFSLPKIIGLPDGAPILIRNGLIQAGTLKYDFDFRWIYYVFEQILRLFVVNVTDMRFFPVWIKVKAEQIFGMLFNSYNTLMSYFHHPNRMSMISKKLLERTDFEKIIENRAYAFKRLHEELKNSKFEKLDIKTIEKHAYFGYPIMVKNREDFLNAMQKRGIKLMTLHYKWSFFKESQKSQYPNAYNFMNHHVIFPVCDHLDQEDVKEVIRIANEF